VEDDMSLALLFRPTGMNKQKYDDLIRRLAAEGAGKPPGRSYHVCFGPADKVLVFDVWESREQFEQFGKTLLPLLKELGIDPGVPEVTPVHGILHG
jgi:hypothetical protein